MDFSGKVRTDRNEFLDEAKGQLFERITDPLPLGHIFAMMAVEMIKNIYDHAGCNGYAHFLKTDSTVEFRIQSYGDAFDYAAAEEIGMTTSSATHNRGIGLQSIADFSEQLGVDLQIDQSDGLLYSGTWKYGR